MSEYTNILKDILSGTVSTFKDILSRAESITCYSDGLRENLMEVNFQLFCTLHSGIEVIDDLVLSEIFHEHYVWAFRNQGLFFVGKELDGSIARNSGGEFQHTYSIHNASRTLLVEAVKRLPVFLKMIARELQTKEHEIKPSYEAANRILQIVETLGEEKPISEGWVIPPDDGRFHYFVDGKSLCGRYKYIGTLQADDWEDGPSDCKKCREKLKKRKAG